MTDTSNAQLASSTLALLVVRGAQSRGHSSVTAPSAPGVEAIISIEPEPTIVVIVRRTDGSGYRMEISHPDADATAMPVGRFSREAGRDADRTGAGR